jgi:hypothetical protein
MYGQNNGYYVPNFQPYYQQNGGSMQDVLAQYKAPYQPQAQQSPQQIAPIPQRQTSDIIWVQGEAGAKGYLVAPNNTVVLWDTESPTIYVKTADGTGIPSMRILDFKEREDVSVKAQKQPDKHACACGDKFITKDEFERLWGKFEALESKYEELLEKTAEKAKTKSAKPKIEEE